MRIKVLDEELYALDVERGFFTPKYEGDAGVDLRARWPVTVHSGITVRVPLGIAVEIPRGYVGWLTGRSSTSLDFGLFAHEGKIDSCYRGEIHAFLTSQGSPVTVGRGERICQLVVLPILDPSLDPWVIVDEMGETTRGDLGLGSSGRM